MLLTLRIYALLEIVLILNSNSDHGPSRKLLQVGKKGKNQHHSNYRTHKSSSSSVSFPFFQSYVHQSGPSLSPLTSSVTIPLPIFLPPIPSNNVPTSHPSPSPTSEALAPTPIFSLNPTILAPYYSLSFPSPAPTINPSSLRETNKRKHSSSRTIYISLGGGVSFLFVMVILFVLCYRANKVVTVRPWSTGLSGQLQKAFVTGISSQLL